MTLVSATLVALAVLVSRPLTAAAEVRLRSLRPNGPAAGVPLRRSPPRRAAAVLLGLGVAAVVGGAVGLVIGSGAAVVAERVLRRVEPAAVRRRRRRLTADLPPTADLLAACLEAGSSPRDAADTVARAVGGPLGAALDEVVAGLCLGADPVLSWRQLGRDPVLEPLGRALARAAEGGAPPAEVLSRMADERRQAGRWAAEAAAAAVSVRVAAPLGLCFLPAFVLVAVVPVVAGLASGFGV